MNDCLEAPQEPLTVPRWENDRTRQVVVYLDREDVHPTLTQLVTVWNDGELLIVDLAKVLRDMVATSLARTGVDPEIELQDVDWDQIAAHYAFALTDVTEEELAARLRKAQETLGE